MGNNHGKNSDCEKGKSIGSSTIDGENREKKSGVGVEKKDSEIHTMKARGATSSDNSQTSEKGKTKRENKNSEKASSKVLIENKTEKTLLLREKIRAANGHVRYTIEAGKSLEIKVGSQSTYYRLLVYAVEFASSSTEDTNLTIDSDMLSDATHIVLCKDESGNYVLNALNA